MSLPNSRHFRVAIVGGGIAGLTLALILERTGVSFVLWEGHESIAPEIGAGIGLLPNGLRILDQLGLLGEIESRTVPLQIWHHINSDGMAISDVEAHKHYRHAFGYGSRFLRRSELLQILYGAIQNKDPVMTSTRLSNIEESEQHSKIVSIDGRWVTADIVVGADGVHSPVRRCVELFVGRDMSETRMAAVADKQTPAPDLANIRSAREAQFACVFGISSPVRGLEAGECFAVYRREATILVLTGKGGIVFWFVFEHRDEADALTEQPTDDTADIENAGRSVAHLQLTTSVTFGDIFANRTSARKTVLDEGLATHWSASRMVIIGDAAHTMVPHLAMGANQAIESAAALSNELLRIHQWELGGITGAIERYTQVRRGRAAAATNMAGMICRAQLCCTGYDHISSSIPRLKFADWMVRALVGFRGAAMVESLPRTKRGQYFDEKMGRFFERLEHRHGQVEGGKMPGLSNEEFLDIFDWAVDWKN
ncbi:hypothetical protein PHISP_00132 [Aspergillus sp. HF37]|nr:hypothetical protein PHISP_00132 [Aspergillus sp. HF37]